MLRYRYREIAFPNASTFTEEVTYRLRINPDHPHQPVGQVPVKRELVAWMPSVRGAVVYTLVLCCSMGPGRLSAEDEGLSIQISHVDPIRGRVYFSVREPDGSPRTALEANDFEFRLAGSRMSDVRLQSFEDDPESRLMVVLGFGSARMTRTQVRNLASAAGRHFLVDMSEAKPDRAAILTFAGDIVVPAHFSADPIRLQEDLRHIQMRGSSIRFFDGLQAGHRLLHETDTMAFGVLVYAVDRRDTSSRYDLMALKHDIAKGGFPIVFTIGINADSALARDLEDVATMSGGASFLIPPRSNRLTHTYALILEMLQHQYVATFDDQMLSGEIEIVHRTGEGSDIVARWALPLKSPAPARIPAYGTALEQGDWRQATLFLVLAGLLLSLGAHRMGWVHRVSHDRKVPQDLRRSGKWRPRHPKMTSGHRRAGAADET